MTVDVKICGLNDKATLEVALEAGAFFVGLVCFPKSPRHVSLGQARALADKARGRARIVVLTVDASDASIVDIGREVRPDYIQCHGSETPERIREIADLADVRTIKAIKVAGRDDVRRADDFRGVADLILFDARAPKGLSGALPGGNGLVFDWSLLDEVPRGMTFMLSGGLSPDNVREAIRVTGARIVDVSSGVEVAPGRKDPDLIRAFMDQVRLAGHIDGGREKEVLTHG